MDEHDLQQLAGPRRVLAASCRSLEVVVDRPWECPGDDLAMFAEVSLVVFM